MSREEELLFIAAQWAYAWHDVCPDVGMGHGTATIVTKVANQCSFAISDESLDRVVFRMRQWLEARRDGPPC